MKFTVIVDTVLKTKEDTTYRLIFADEKDVNPYIGPTVYNFTVPCDNNEFKAGETVVITISKKEKHND